MNEEERFWTRYQEDMRRDNDPEDDRPSKVGMAAAIIVTVMLALVVVCLLVWCGYRR